MDAQNISPQLDQDKDTLTLNLEGTTEKKSLKKWPIITAIIIAIIAVAAVIVSYVINKPTQDQVLSIKDVERGAVNFDIFSGLDIEDSFGHSAEMNIKINKFALNMLTSKYPELNVLEGINGMTIDAAYEHNNGLDRLYLCLDSDNAAIAPLEVILNAEEQCLYICSEAFQNRYLKHDYSNEAQESDIQLAHIIVDTLFNSKMNERYFEHFLDLMNNENIKTESLTSSDVTERCTVYSAEIDIRALAHLLLDYLEEMNQEDEAYCGEIDSLTERIEEALEADEEPGILYWAVITNNSGEIIGREISADNEQLLYYLLTTDSEDFGLELSVSTMEITGNAELDKGIIDGSFIVSADGTDYFTVDVEEFDVEAFMDGMANGKLELEPTDAFIKDVLGLEIGIPLSLTMEFESSKDDADIVISIMEMATISIKLKKFEPDTISLPEGEELSTNDPKALFGLLGGFGSS